MELINFSFFGIGVWNIDLDYCDGKWFALETNRDISVFVPVPYCLDDCGFVVEPEVRLVFNMLSRFVIAFLPRSNRGFDLGQK